MALDCLVARGNGQGVGLPCGPYGPRASREDHMLLLRVLGIWGWVDRIWLAIAPRGWARF